MPRTTTYHSDAMNFDFVYPASFAAPKGGDDDSSKEQSGSNQGGPTKPGCISVPVAVMDMRTGFNMIFLKRYDENCLNKSIDAAGLGTVVTNALSDTLGQLGKPVISSNTDYEIAGNSASTVSGSVVVPHARGKSVIYGAASCVRAGNNLACFQFISNDCPTLVALSASAVKFGNAASIPVIPSKLAPPCKP